MPLDNSRMQDEWLEADGLGGFASGTVGGVRTRRYHALLLSAMTPPTGRVVLVNGIEAWVEMASARHPLTSHRYAPDVIHPEGRQYVVEFQHEPWPHWTFVFPNAARIVQEILVRHDAHETLIRWSCDAPTGPMRLHVRPLLSGRDYHALHRENPSFGFDARLDGENVTWTPYAGLPAVTVLSNGTYRHAPDWYRNFLYRDEQARGLDCVEDLASPGDFTWDLSKSEAVLILRAEPPNGPRPAPTGSAVEHARQIVAGESARRSRFESPLARAADSYIVRRRDGRTIVAGYPWFTDWGRDAFIALRGLCIARGDLETAKEILVSWSGHVSEGMLPNRFPDGGEEPEYNSVDASLWYVVAVHEFLEAAASKRGIVHRAELRALRGAAEAIVEGYARGTRFGIRMNADGLLAAGAPGVQLTWMDAKIGDWVVTPRIGKPVEVQALWLNALQILARRVPKWHEVLQRARRAFAERFPCQDAASLYDVVDVDHTPGRFDASFRPNQILAVGGLPFALLEGQAARAIVDAVEARLLTPVGLRSLAPGEPGYRERYEGGVWERDSSYHQGTVWPWLMGPFVEAWLRVRGSTDEAKREAYTRFVEPIVQHLETAGLGHVSEIADADPPHTPRGCPFQAWSVGELIRMLKMTDHPPLKPGGTGRRGKSARVRQPVTGT
jgi:predicted glycogen debranching enzyme